MNRTSATPLVLVVDDNRLTRLATATALRKSGFEVVEAEDGEAALASVARAAPDLVLLDVLMPRMDGYQVCERLRDDPGTALIPVVFLSCLGAEPDKARAFAAGAAGYLVKPVPREVLVARVRRDLSTAERWRHLEPPTTDPSPPSASPEPMSTVADAFGRFAAFLDALRSSGLVPPMHHHEISQLAPRTFYAQLAEWGVDESSVAAALARFLGVQLETAIVPEDLRMGVLPTVFCVENQVVPILRAGNDAIALSNPFDWDVTEAVTRVLGRRWLAGERISIVPPSAIQSLAKPRSSGIGPLPNRGDARAPATLGEAEREMERAFALADVRNEVPRASAEIDDVAGPAIRFVDQLIESALRVAATDIHIEPEEEWVDVRFRVDGQLRRVSRIGSLAAGAALVSRIKVMCRLDISERRLPQDGRMTYRSEASARPVDVDVRVATAPSHFGEMVAMRLLERGRPMLSLEDLGFSARSAELYRAAIHNPYGMILHAGPTGSGKTSTLYSALNEIQNPAIKILTIEDPVEYAIPGVSQVQVHPEIGLDFERALRSFLRLDPDVLLVGEIRDLATARTAVEAALTGHLLLATLHAPDAAATVMRLTELGVEPVVVSSAVLLVCAQRLVRRLCVDCREPYEPSARERELVGRRGEVPARLYRPVGCARCDGTGHKGRIGVHELLMLDDELRALTKDRGTTAQALRDAAVRRGMRTLCDDAMGKVAAGLVGLAEALTAVMVPAAAAIDARAGATLAMQAA